KSSVAADEIPRGYILLFPYPVDTPRGKLAATHTCSSVGWHLTGGQKIVKKFLSPAPSRIHENGGGTGEALLARGENNSRHGLSMRYFPRPNTLGVGPLRGIPADQRSQPLQAGQRLRRFLVQSRTKCNSPPRSRGTAQSCRCR